MTTKCYQMLRGSSVRVTGLTDLGSVPSPILFATSKSVVSVQINETTESGSNELVKGADDEPLLRFTRSEEVMNYTVDIDFLRTDPGILKIVAGSPLVLNAAGAVVGFDSDTRISSASFSLEVWSRLAATDCAAGPQYGYSVFPFLRGGWLTGFRFANGRVSFSLRGARSRRVPRWGVGPYDLEGAHQRLMEVVSRNTLIRTFITSAAPPEQVDGIQQTTDIVDGGAAGGTSGDVIDGEFVETSSWIVEGGRAV